MGRDSQREGIFQFKFELSDHVELDLDSFVWLNVSDTDVHD